MLGDHRDHEHVPGLDNIARLEVVFVHRRGLHIRMAEKILPSAVPETVTFEEVERFSLPHIGRVVNGEEPVAVHGDELVPVELRLDKRGRPLIRAAPGADVPSEILAVQVETPEAAQGLIYEIEPVSFQKPVSYQGGRGPVYEQGVHVQAGDTHGLPPLVRKAFKFGMIAVSVAA